MKKIGVTELVLRDGHQSLIATRMRTDDMLPICERLAAAGFWSLEVWGGATFDACVRFLREDPWQRLRGLRQALPGVRLQMLLRGQNLLGYRHYADDVVAAFVRRAKDNGMDVFRVFDALNDFRNMQTALRAVKEAGGHAQGTICYTTSPVHRIAGFVALAEKFRDAGCDSVAIKDMAGIMTPAACAELTAAIKARVDLPLHIHSHYTSGLSAMCLLRAADSGADVLDTAISPFAEGASHPATETMAAALQNTGFDTGLDLDLLADIADYFRRVRAKYWQFESEYTRVDPRVLKHHVPGGMISNLANQLKEQNALDKMDAVLEEIPRVRRDLGYPPLVTPASQIIGAQAVLNVLLGERYQTVTKEVKNYLAGRYGAAPGEIDPEVRQKAVGDAPAEGLEESEAELEKLRGEIGALAQSEEDVLTYAMFPDIGKAFLQERAAGQLKPPPLLPREEAAAADSARRAPSDFRITLHGETYHIKVSGVGHKSAEQRPFYVTVDGVPEEVLVETLEEVAVDGSAAGAAAASPARRSGRPKASAPGHVTTAMPGTVVAVLVERGQTVKAGDPVLVVEAMKMESEIQAPIDGAIVGVLVAKGDAVTPDEVLIEIGH